MDVLCFQEFGDNSDFPTDSIRRILSHWSHALIPSEDSVKGVLPIAVFSRYPLANHRFITYQHSSNCSMMCDVVMGTDTIRLINNHLQTTSVSQKRRKWERELATDDTRREVQAAKDAAGTLHENFMKRATQTYVISHYAKTSPYPVLLLRRLQLNTFLLHLPSFEENPQRRIPHCRKRIHVHLPLCQTHVAY